MPYLNWAIVSRQENCQYAICSSISRCDDPAALYTIVSLLKQRVSSIRLMTGKKTTNISSVSFLYEYGKQDSYFLLHISSINNDGAQQWMTSPASIQEAGICNYYEQCKHWPQARATRSPVYTGCPSWCQWTVPAVNWRGTVQHQNQSPTRCTHPTAEPKGCSNSELLSSSWTLPSLLHMNYTIHFVKNILTTKRKKKKNKFGIA